MLRLMGVIIVLAGLGFGIHLYLRQSIHAPSRLLIYIDRTASTKGAGVGKARWLDAGDRILAWLRSAPPGSEIEAWTTSAVPGQPISILRFKVYKRLRDQNKEVARVIPDIEAAYERYRRSAAGLSYSPIFEDIHALMKRGDQMKWPYEAVICTDLEQVSPDLTLARILRSNDSQQQALVKRAVQDMPAPARAPDRLEIVCYPGGANLKGHERTVLETFTYSLTDAWGARGEITQPQRVETSERPGLGAGSSQTQAAAR